MAVTLAEVEAAISVILDEGQSVTIDGQTVDRANISVLYKLRESLRGEEVAASSSAYGRTCGRRARGAW